MKILLLGSTGQLGVELTRALVPLGELITATREQVNFTDLPSLRQFIIDSKPEWIINAVAYTQVDQAENDREQAMKVNADAVAVLAQASQCLGAWLVHFSTDYVFDGEKAGQHLETDIAKPLSVYGQSKLAGEQHIQAANGRYLIFRTSWLYGAHGNNFVKTILNLAKKQSALTVIADQFGAPTPAALVADVCAVVIKQLMNGTAAFAGQRSGLYHLSTGGDTCWFAFARHIVGQALARGLTLNLESENIGAVSSVEYARKFMEKKQLLALRPKNSRLNTDKIQQAFAISLPCWQSAFDSTIDDIINSLSDKS